MRDMIPDDALALDLPPDLAASDWLAVGRRLSDQHRRTEWMIGDWYRHGERHLRADPQFRLFADALALDPRRITAAARVADAFPPHLRAADVPFRVHAYIAALPEPQRLPALHRARSERWGERQARAAVTAERQQAIMFEDEDAEVRLAVEIIRAWNRAPVESRRYAYELMDGRTLAAIDEDRAL